MKKKVVLAFSGGLDTSYCSKYLSDDLGYEVHAVTVNTGGFSSEQADGLRAKALSLGASSFDFIDVTQSFYDKGIKYLLFGNVLKNQTYPLSVSSERIFQAMAIAEYANKIEATAIAHGSTGAGNDQIRFDTVFHTLCPDKEIITPIRDQQLSRLEEIVFLKSKGVDGDWTKAEYSINQGLWGTSIGGKETLTSHLPLPEDAYPHKPSESAPQMIRLAFEKDEPVAMNGQKHKPVELIHALNKLTSKFAIGRDVHVGDTIIGIKGRVGFEAGAALVLIKSHQLLEKHVLSKQQLFIKDQLANWYGDMMHEGRYLDPSMRDIESFLSSSQKHVSGEVQVELAPYRFHVLGIESPFDLMQAAGTQYGETQGAWSPEDVRGFAKILSVQSKIYHSVHHD